ncbi:PIR Superfamily Protein [Plasmodium ovale curtisi]|uniref:PIR Superfamily Protein n=1 Tax=Plasmodium ovale curtisi TaxID=864141 RepID=A0A1A8VMR4_PLAOA|nr:PIR Superfamily Protein [Plasmodium ovale curtisi]
MVIVKDLLPSQKHDLELGRGIRYGIFKKFVSIKFVKGIQKWISNFPQHLNNYLKQQVKSWPKNDSSKRCRDLNYILDNINYKLNELKIYELVRGAHEIDVFAIKTIPTYKELKCARTFSKVDNKLTHIRKLLDNLCEDASYIQTNIKEIKNRGICRKIISNIEKRIDILTRAFSDTSISTNKFFKFKDSCTIENITNILKPISCTIEHEPLAVPIMGNRERASLIKVEVKGQPSEAEAEDEDALAKPFSQHVPFGDDPEPGEVEEYLSEDESSPHLKTTSIGLSVSGAIAAGLFLYKTTPLGSWINSKILNNNSISSLNAHESEDFLMDNFDPVHSSLNQDYEINYHMASIS